MTKIKNEDFIIPMPQNDKRRSIPVPILEVTPNKAFTMERGRHGWVLATLTYSDDGKLLDIERSEPDLKMIIIEKFKIAAFKYWTSIG